MTESLSPRSGQAARIAAKEAELARAREAFDAECARQVGGSSRRKSFGVRLDAQIRRAAKLGADVQRIERELQALRVQGVREHGQAGRHDALTLAGVRYVRTDIGWHEVVKVNRVSVKVKVRPGMDDLIKIAKILEARDAGGATLPADVLAPPPSSPPTDRTEHRMTDTLPSWDALSDLDKGAALLHDRARESEGDDYAAEHYPAVFIDDPRLTALSPADATAYARRVCEVDSGDMFDRLGGDEYFRLHDLAAEHGKPAAPVAVIDPVEAAPTTPTVPPDVTAAINAAVAQGLPAPLKVAANPNNSPLRMFLTLHLSTVADVDRWARHVGATVGHDDYTYLSDPNGPRDATNLVHEYGTSWEGGAFGRWLGRQVGLCCEVPGDAPSYREAVVSGHAFERLGRAFDRTHGTDRTTEVDK